MTRTVPSMRRAWQAGVGAALTGVLVTGALGVPARAAGAESLSGVEFTLGAEVLDGGQQITSLTLDTSEVGGVDPASLAADTFTVHATGTSPVAGAEPLYSTYDVDRVVTDARVDASGDVVLSLEHGQGVPGASTLAYSGELTRNLLLDLAYTVTQNDPLLTSDGQEIVLEDMVQGDTVDPEVDRFAYGETSEGLKYRLFSPDGLKRNDRRPLIVWLHGNGEGGAPGHYNDESQLLANRGALGLTTPEAQSIFRGAYVVAPQVPDTWYDIDVSGYDVQVKALIDEVAATGQVDPNRIYVMGASAGGFMTVQMAGRYPTFFAAAVPTAPALFLNRTGEYTVTEDEVLRLNSTPTWFIHAKNDPTVPYEKSSLWAYELLDDARLTLYDNVVRDGVEYNGHWSWIYTARNAPTSSIGASDNERSLWEWISRQTTRHPGTKD